MSLLVVGKTIRLTELARYVSQKVDRSGRILGSGKGRVSEESHTLLQRGKALQCRMIEYVDLFAAEPDPALLGEAFQQAADDFAYAAQFIR